MEYAAKMIRDEGGKHSERPLSKAIITTKICTYILYFYRDEQSDDLIYCLVDKDLKLLCSLLFRLVIRTVLFKRINEQHRPNFTQTDVSGTVGRTEGNTFTTI